MADSGVKSLEYDGSSATTDRRKFFEKSLEMKTFADSASQIRFVAGFAGRVNGVAVPHGGLKQCIDATVEEDATISSRDFKLQVMVSYVEQWKSRWVSNPTSSHLEPCGSVCSLMAGRDNFEAAKILMFNGKSPYSWIMIIERFFRVCQVSEAERLSWMSVCFEGDALYWYNKELFGGEFRNWSELRKRLLAQFAPVKNSSRQAVMLQKELISQSEEEPKATPEEDSIQDIKVFSDTVAMGMSCVTESLEKKTIEQPIMATKLRPKVAESRCHTNSITRESSPQEDSSRKEEAMLQKEVSIPVLESGHREKMLEGVDTNMGFEVQQQIISNVGNPPFTDMRNVIWIWDCGGFQVLIHTIRGTQEGIVEIVLRSLVCLHSPNRSLEAEPKQKLQTTHLIPEISELSLIFRSHLLVAHQEEQPYELLVEMIDLPLTSMDDQDRQLAFHVFDSISHKIEQRTTMHKQRKRFKSWRFKFKLPKHNQVTPLAVRKLNTSRRNLWNTCTFPSATMGVIQKKRISLSRNLMKAADMYWMMFRKMMRLGSGSLRLFFSDDRSLTSLCNIELREEAGIPQKIEKSSLRTRRMRTGCRARHFKYKQQLFDRLSLRYTYPYSKAQVGLGKTNGIFQRLRKQTHMSRLVCKIKLRCVHGNLIQVLLADMKFFEKHQWKSTHLQTTSDLLTKHSYDLEVVYRSEKLQTVSEHMVFDLVRFQFAQNTKPGTATLLALPLLTAPQLLNTHIENTARTLQELSGFRLRSLKRFQSLNRRRDKSALINFSQPPELERSCVEWIWLSLLPNMGRINTTTRDKIDTKQPTLMIKLEQPELHSASQGRDVVLQFHHQFKNVQYILQKIAVFSSLSMEYTWGTKLNKDSLLLQLTCTLLQQQLYMAQKTVEPGSHKFFAIWHRWRMRDCVHCASGMGEQLYHVRSSQVGAVVQSSSLLDMTQVLPQQFSSFQLEDKLRLRGWGIDTFHRAFYRDKYRGSQYIC